MRVLHIVRQLDDERALATARTHALEHPTDLLLIQDAVLNRVTDFPGVVYACAEDIAARRETGDYQQVDYQQIVQLLFDHDKVITW